MEVVSLQEVESLAQWSVHPTGALLAAGVGAQAPEEPLPTTCGRGRAGMLNPWHRERSWFLSMQLIQQIPLERHRPTHPIMHQVNT